MDLFAQLFEYEKNNTQVSANNIYLPVILVIFNHLFIRYLSILILIFQNLRSKLYNLVFVL